MTSVLRSSLLSQFVCTGDACPDTCCKGWSMQVDEDTLSRYKNEAPELLGAVEKEPDGSFIMKKSPATSYCVKLDGGLCGIQQAKGENFLGDACFFYPRVTRSLGSSVLMTATLSCPEIARLALTDSAWEFSPVELARLPHVKDYLPGALSPEDALAVHHAFLAPCDDEEASAERILARLGSVARSFELIGQDKWAAAANFYLRSADGRLPEPSTNENDPFNLLHALCGLIVASKKPATPRLQQLLDEMTEALHVTIDWRNVQMNLADNSHAAYGALQKKWQQNAARYQPLLRRWLKMQLSVSLFPFSGLGETLPERITILGVRLATLRLAILCSCDISGMLAFEDTVRVVQTLSRVLDHLGDSRFSLQIYAETQWSEEARMLGLLNL